MHKNTAFILVIVMPGSIMTKCETVPLSQNGIMLDLFKQTAWCPGLK